MDDYAIDDIDVNEDNVTLEDKWMAVINRSGNDEELRWNQIKDVLTEIDLANVASAFEKKWLEKSTVHWSKSVCCQWTKTSKTWFILLKL